jgi:peptide chain release factor 3
VSPEDEKFSAFVFKMQSNMDPKHRDIIAFARIVSGKFEREMSVFHSRENKRIRLSDAHRLFARDRETVDEAYPGDVIGLVGGAEYRVGDTISDERGLTFDEMPRFTPECFATLENPVTANFKKFRRGLDQLLDEGVVQPFEMGLGQMKTLLLGAVGPLQFDIVQYRLQAEYGAESHLHNSRFDRIRWLVLPDGTKPEDLLLPSGAALGFDVDKHPVILLENEWEERSFKDRNPKVTLSAIPPKLAKSPSQTLVGNVSAAD